MWTGSSGPYRAPQVAQGVSPQPNWSIGAANHDASHGARFSASAHPTAMTGPSGSLHRASAQGSVQNGVGADGIPEPPKTFPELENMSLRSLRLLRDENAKFEDFVSKHQHQRMVDEVVSRVKASVDSFEREHAGMNSMAGHSNDAKDTSELRQKISALEEEVRNLQTQKDEWMEHNSNERLMEKLQMAMRESELNSESLEKGMLSSSMNFDTFLAEYIACRKKHHERSLKLEQLKLERKKKSFSR